SAGAAPSAPGIRGGSRAPTGSRNAPRQSQTGSVVGAPAGRPAGPENAAW
ncbi:unnamed protein product, partial [Rotaria magnacalcarata]